MQKAWTQLVFIIPCRRIAEMYLAFSLLNSTSFNTPVTYFLSYFLVKFGEILMKYAYFRENYSASSLNFWLTSNALPLTWFFGNNEIFETCWVLCLGDLPLSFMKKNSAHIDAMFVFAIFVPCWIAVVVSACKFTRLSIEVIEYGRFQITIFVMITVSLDLRTVNVFLFLVEFVCIWTTVMLSPKVPVCVCPYPNLFTVTVTKNYKRNELFGLSSILLSVSSWLSCISLSFSCQDYQVRETREAWMSFQRHRPVVVPGTGARSWPNSRPAGRKYQLCCPNNQKVP